MHCPDMRLFHPALVRVYQCGEAVVGILNGTEGVGGLQVFLVIFFCAVFSIFAYYLGTPKKSLLVEYKISLESFTL